MNTKNIILTLCAVLTIHGTVQPHMLGDAWSDSSRQTRIAGGATLGAAGLWSITRWMISNWETELAHTNKLSARAKQLQNNIRKARWAAKVLGWGAIGGAVATGMLGAVDYGKAQSRSAGGHFGSHFEEGYAKAREAAERVRPWRGAVFSHLGTLLTPEERNELRATWAKNPTVPEYQRMSLYQKELARVLRDAVEGFNLSDSRPGAVSALAEKTISALNDVKRPA